MINKEESRESQYLRILTSGIRDASDYCGRGDYRVDDVFYCSFSWIA